MKPTRSASLRIHIAASAASAFVAIATASGCGESRSSLPIHPVSGKVVLPSGKPLDAGVIHFQPVAAPGLEAKGKIQADGSFTLSTYGEDDGAAEGDSRVYIEPENAAEKKKGGVPPEFLDADSSGLVVTVKPGPNQLEPIVLKPRGSSGARTRR